METKVCKLCNVEQDRKHFSGRSARCCKCMYAKNKEFFVKYYEENAEKMKTYEKDKCHLKFDDVPKKKRGRKPNPIL